MERKIMISGDFNINEVNTQSNGAAVTMPKKAQERVEALKKAGVDTSNLFAMGEGMVVRVVGGVPSEVLDDDPVWKAIMSAGTVPDRRLFRRWVLAQTFYMLRHDYTLCMKSKGYEYTWRMVEEELRVQAKLCDHDNENFILRNRFFNKDVVMGMMKDYAGDVKNYIDGLKVRHCKGVECKRFYGRDVFVSDLDGKVYSPIRSAERKVEAATTPKALYEAVRALNKARIPMHGGTAQSAHWVDAYKGAGAYFSMQNLIRFHGMTLHKPNKRSYTTVSGEKAIAFLDECAGKKRGWELLGMLKEALEYNGINIDKKMDSWRK